jgi:DNA-binding response OmpR family regulator
MISHTENPCSTWAAFLCRRGWAVKVCRSSGEFLREAAGQALTLALIDEAMVGEMPVGLVKKHDKAAPLILFAKERTMSNKNIAQYLHDGFDDFIEADIDPRVLEAKLLVNLRWALPVSARAMEEVRSRSGRIKVNSAQRRVIIKKAGGFSEISSLTCTELNILALLVGSEGAVVERRFIVDNVWRGKVVNSENVDKHVEALRAKLACYGRNIETVYGAGYCYREDK